MNSSVRTFPVLGLAFSFLVFSGCGGFHTATISTSQESSTSLQSGLVANSTPLWNNDQFSLVAFKVDYDVVPSENATAGEDAVIGLSNGVASQYTDLAAIVRFGPNGIDVRDGASYRALTAVPYQAGTTYHIEMDVNVSRHSYGVTVSSGGQPPILVAQNFAFRTEQARAPSLTNFSYYSDMGGAQLANITIEISLVNPSPTPTPAPSPTSTPTPSPTPTPTPTPAAGAFPGQPGNPVGYTAAPGYPGHLTPWTGGNLSASGTATKPLVYSFYDFNGGAGGTSITGSHLKFVGCRFQSNQVQYFNVMVTGSDVTFAYSSVVPLVSLVTAPPHAAWPSAGAGQQLIGNGTGYQIGGSDGYEFGIFIPSGGPVTVDHADIWGFGNAIDFMSTTAQMTISNSWIHDAADAGTQGYHTDGPGYLNGAAAPQNISIIGNTIASIGNTNAIAFQATTTSYKNLNVSGNYISGFGYAVTMGLPTGNTSGFTNVVFQNNVLGTDLPWVWGPLYGNEMALFTQVTNVWSGNSLHVLPGTSPVPSSGFRFSPSQSGYFLWPDSTLHTSDF